LTAAESFAVAAANACTAAGRALTATAADRLFDDFVYLVIIGVAVGIALYAMKAVKKFFSGMVG
jgi:predicted cation transporter